MSTWWALHVACVPMIAVAPAEAIHGMVATSHPRAVAAGLEILQAGGNAVDAAIAANAVLGVVEPMSCGVGGDLFVLLWDAKSRKLYGLNASGRAPYAASREFFREKGLEQIPETGPLSWSVPGCVDGWEKLRSRFGTMPFATLLEPAIRAAEEGFTVSPIIGSDWQASEKMLSADPDAAKTWLLNGKAPAVGSTMTNRLLGKTLRRLAERGSAEFYRGGLAEEILAVSKERGGLFSRRDLEETRADWVEPVSTEFRGHDVWELPPPGQGIAALQMLNLLEPYDLKGMGHNSVAYLHHLVEAKKLAFEDRARYYADPEAEPRVPTAELISKAYAARRRQGIDPARAASKVEPGDPKLSRGDTVYLTVVDKNRNAVSMIQSIYFGWGSRVPAGELGFMLQNRGCLFSLDEEDLNRLEPHKRPFHTIIPAMATKDGRPYLSFGVMGGDMQPQGHVQVLLNMLVFGMDPQAAGAAARFRHFGSSTPTGFRSTTGGQVMLESEIPEEVAAGLRSLGHQVVRGPSGNFGGYQCILIDEASGKLIGGSDPRKDGLAKGY